jgi:UDP-N-acetylglucosamine 2-epimerase (non-hydrolysing)
MGVSKKRVLIIMGTRPEAIKMAPVIQTLRERSGSFEVGVCATSQHRRMMDQVLDFFNIVPDFDLDIMRDRQELHEIACRVISGVHEVLRIWRPDWVVVQGDTTTTFAAGVAAFYEGVRVAHVEAGLRTGNMYAPWPEEANRRLTSVISSLHFAPTACARENLLQEGVPEKNIRVTGHTVIDALLRTAAAVSGDSALARQLASRFSYLDRKRKMILVTAHRRESFGAGFERICKALRKIALGDSVEIVYPVHLNPNVQRPVHKLLGGLHHVHLLEPLQYAEFVYLMDRSYLIITDSGGVQEEAPSLGKPVLVMRDVTERPEAVAAGAARVVGTAPEKIVSEAHRLLHDQAEYQKMSQSGNPYGDGKAARRIADALSAEEERRERRKVLPGKMHQLCRGFSEPGCTVNEY